MEKEENCTNHEAVRAPVLAGGTAPFQEGSFPT